MADICEVDTHISQRYDVKKRLGKGVSGYSFFFSSRSEIEVFIAAYMTEVLSIQ